MNFRVFTNLIKHLFCFDVANCWRLECFYNLSIALELKWNSIAISFRFTEISVCANNLASEARSWWTFRVFVESLNFMALVTHSHFIVKSLHHDEPLSTTYHSRSTFNSMQEDAFLCVKFSVNFLLFFVVSLFFLYSIYFLGDVFLLKM